MGPLLDTGQSMRCDAEPHKIALPCLHLLSGRHGAGTGFHACIEKGWDEAQQDMALGRDPGWLTVGLLRQAVAIERNLFSLDTTPPSLQQRIFIDRYATDSYQNILLSLVQWPLFVRQVLCNDLPSKQSTGSEMPWPTKLTIVSHEFKRARFLELHLPAIAWNRETVFVGIDPPFDRVRMAEIEEGDRLRGYGAWKGDPYGIGEVPRGKRVKRGWDGNVFRREVLDSLGGMSVKEELERVVFWDGGGGEGRLLEGVSVPWA